MSSIYLHRNAAMVLTVEFLRRKKGRGNCQATLCDDDAAAADDDDEDEDEEEEEEHSGKSHKYACILPMY